MVRKKTVAESKTVAERKTAKEKKTTPEEKTTNITEKFKPGFVLGKFRKINIIVKKIWSNTWKDSTIDQELTPVQGATIGFLIDNSDRDLFQKDVEKEFNITGATATNILKCLEKCNMIRRESVENDGRLKKITVTELGKHHDENALRALKKIENNMFNGMSEEEIILFNNLLEKCVSNLEILSQNEIN
ncbi:MarR family winged helix-turn-helix transcriptional regulator [Lachnobacterium bovis]|uniref:MarR family winged helix-turn-helix transcriptional regulator n=1 Tax=Lachnobacterium bovis TaxID=140626 RepID=UPI0003B48137|nr:MarR family winged helix-turn-helix transcriptional regulator [Lachnobacterium bovis]